MRFNHVHFSVIMVVKFGLWLQIFFIHRLVPYRKTAPKSTFIWPLQRPLFQIFSYFAFLSERTTGTTADPENVGFETRRKNISLFPRVPANFSQGVNPNTPLPKEICALKHDWFAATPIQLLSFWDYSAKRKYASNAWQILRYSREVGISWKEN